MAEINYIHSEETRQNWLKQPIAYQMGNIGSEVSRALKWTAKGNKQRADKAIDRALELFDFTIEANVKNRARLTEILKARDEFCDYFFNHNSYHTDPIRMQKYYDGFAIMMLYLADLNPIGSDFRQQGWPKIAEISDQNFGFNHPRKTKTHITRFCVRILLFNNQNEICVVKSTKHDFLQLPGGGIEKGETIEQALRRETEEETGYLIYDIEPLGYTIEKREDILNTHKWEHGISYVFKASPGKEVGTKYMPDEIAEGFTPIWIKFDDFIKTQEQKQGKIKSYSGNFSNRRDLLIAKYFQTHAQTPDNPKIH